MAVLLDEELGVNPTMTYCPRCGGQTNELALVGRAYKYRCKYCGIIVVGRNPKRCPNPDCNGRFGDFVNEGKFDGTHEKLPASYLCDNCKKEIEEFKLEVEKGGVPWRCSDCGSEGVVKHDSDFAKKFREVQGKGVGVMFSKETCPVCNKERSVPNDNG
jgi:rubrerythrin